MVTVPEPAVTVTTGNPLPANGFIEFQLPPSFVNITSRDFDEGRHHFSYYTDTSRNSTSRATQKGYDTHMVEWQGRIYAGLDGNISVSVVNDTRGVGARKVVLWRSGVNTAVPKGTRVEVALCCVQNMKYEGPTGAVPLVRTVLADGATTIDEASNAYDSSGERAASITIKPGVFEKTPVIAPVDLEAGVKGSLYANFTPSNPIPADGAIVLQVPAGYSHFNVTSLTALHGIDGDWNAGSR